MSEFRQSFASGEWVVVAGNRSGRPTDFHDDKGSVRKGLPEVDPKCPFCPGGRAERDAALYEIKEGDDWRLRVLDNKFAALNTDVSPKREPQGHFLRGAGYGKAEVIVESNLHNVSLATMPIENVADVLTAYRLRYNAMAEDSHLNVINIFKNHGPKAGASLNHPHSQMIGSMVTTPHVSYQINYARTQFDTWGECVYCRMIDEEREQGVRVIQESDHFIAFCPFAAKSPYEIRILPKRHSSVFGNIETEEILDFARVLNLSLRRLYILLDDPDYNFIIRSVTTNDQEVQFYHWYMVIIPRVTSKAGFEIGTGIHINSAPPEMCAEQLLAVDADNPVS